jgi:hypothetical protein
MKRFFIPAIELCGLIAAIYFGVQWYLHPNGNYEAAFALSGVIAFLSEWFRRHIHAGVEADKVSAFIHAGQALMSRKEEVPLPVVEYNAWVSSMETYFRKFRRADYAIRLNDFSGLTF